MSTFEMPIALGLSEIDIEVTYSVFGKDLPGTYNDPPEYAELSVEEITYKNKDLYWILNVIKDEIEEQCWEHYRYKQEEVDPL
jgi:hypothetical protein